MSIPEATPAELMMPSSTTRYSRSTATPAFRASRVSRAPQCVVACRPSRSPALARRSEPVHAEVTLRAPAAARRIQSSVSANEVAGPQVRARLLDLCARVHHKRPVARDRLVKRSSGREEEAPTAWAGGCLHGVAVTEDDEGGRMHGRLPRPEANDPLVD